MDIVLVEVITHECSCILIQSMSKKNDCLSSLGNVCLDLELVQMAKRGWGQLDRSLLACGNQCKFPRFE